MFVAAPVGALPELIGEVLAHAPAGCAVSDVGSTKRTIVVEAIADPRFVGGHPLAGAETSGVEHARADMFDGATWYLTPSSDNGRHDACARTGSGQRDGRDARRDRAPLAHDRLMATVSHLPHVFANVLVTQLAAADAAAVPGPSFRDATRVAGLQPSRLERDLHGQPRRARRGDRQCGRAAGRGACSTCRGPIVTRWCAGANRRPPIARG